MEPAAVANQLGFQSYIDLGRSVGGVLRISSMVAGIDLSTPSAHFTPVWHLALWLGSTSVREAP